MTRDKNDVGRERKKSKWVLTKTEMEMGIVFNTLEDMEELI